MHWFEMDTLRTPARFILADVETFLAWLRDRRKEKGLSQAKLALMVGNGLGGESTNPDSLRVQYQRYESGERFLPLDVALLITDALDIPRSVTIAAYVAAYGGPVHNLKAEDRDGVLNIVNPEELELVKLFRGTRPELRPGFLDTARGIYKVGRTAADIAHEEDEARTIGKRSDRSEKPSWVDSQTQEDIAEDDGP